MVTEKFGKDYDCAIAGSVFFSRRRSRSLPLLLTRSSRGESEFEIRYSVDRNNSRRAGCANLVIAITDIDVVIAREAVQC